VAAEVLPAPPCAFVIFGAAGNLTKRLLVPALCNLAAARLLPEHFALVGVARADGDAESFRADLRSATPIADRLLQHTTYLRGDFDDPNTYMRLAAHLGSLQPHRASANRLYYLATPPDSFSLVSDHLGRSGLSRETNGCWRRIVVEKPFGTDLRTAQNLNHRLLCSFAEHQIYRIDHYLGKETVQNLMVLRFANGLFEPLWNRQHIDHVQITVAEAATVGSRGKYYDAVGALRDMVPNHLFQLLMLAAMEPPVRFDAEAVRTEKGKVLDALPHLTADAIVDHAVRGQYGSGTIDGKAIEAYRRTSNVSPQSTTESFVALRLSIDNWRWAGVPFYLRTGKAMTARKTEIAVKFKHAPFAMFRNSPIEHLVSNFLVLRIQPDEGIALHFNAKVPGQTLRTDGVRMDFRYSDHFKVAPTTGYETLLYDCMCGDATLFQRAEDVEAGWRVVQPILDAWRETPARDFPNYPAGSLGPASADELIARDGRRWRDLT
jgi:glucose-6-phosphate 1-dehydrogenase